MNDSSAAFRVSESRRFALKRLIDVLAAALGLLFLSPLLLIMAVLIRINLGRPVLFRQTRIGYHEQPFELIKFRSMRNLYGMDGRPLPDEQRIIPFGAWLRRTSIDELPELWNVLKGQMSLLGPRPLPPMYQPFFLGRERQRFHVRPGITGLAQISGRNQLSWNQRLGYDTIYVEQYSLLLDLYILVRTAMSVLRHQGVEVLPTTVLQDLNVERRWVVEQGRTKRTEEVE